MLLYVCVSVSVWFCVCVWVGGWVVEIERGGEGNTDEERERDIYTARERGGYERTLGLRTLYSKLLQTNNYQAIS